MRTKSLLVVLAGILMAWHMVVEHPLGLGNVDAVVGRSSELVQMVVCAFFVLPFAMLHAFAFVLGSSTLFVLIWFAVKSRLPPGVSSLATFVIPVLGGSWLAMQALPFLRLPTGTVIRPMGWALYVMMASVALSVLSITKAASDFRRRGNRITFCASLAVSLLLIAVPGLSLRWVAQIRGLVLAE